MGVGLGVVDGVGMKGLEGALGGLVVAATHWSAAARDANDSAIADACSVLARLNASAGVGGGLAARARTYGSTVRKMAGLPMPVKPSRWGVCAHRQ